MSPRGPYRRHSAQFKLQLCHEIVSPQSANRYAMERITYSACFRLRPIATPSLWPSRTAQRTAPAGR